MNSRWLYHDVMSDQRWPGRLVRVAALTLASLMALVFQLVAVAGIGIDWAAAYDVMHGGCGWDGTCSQAGSLPLSFWCSLALVSLELIVGLVTASATRLAIAITAGCVASWALMFQDSVVFRLAATQYPGIAGTQAQGQFFITWSTRILVAETALALLAWFVAARWRRSRRTRLSPG